MNEISSPTRRRFLGILAGSAAILPLARLGTAQAADLPHVATDDATAKSLGYVEDASKLSAATEKMYKPGSHCGGCVLFQGGTAEWGGCAIFPGKAVHNTGWCRSYAAKA